MDYDSESEIYSDGTSHLKEEFCYRKDNKENNRQQNLRQHKLKMQDLSDDYAFDVITCFEHPLMAALEYKQRNLGKCYGVLAKMRGTYSERDVRDCVYKEAETGLGIRFIPVNKLSYKRIREYIDKDCPVIVGVNLKRIFYSNYYPDRNWRHWFLVTGYRESGGIIHILDNTQFKNIGQGYDDFRITFDMLREANKSYIRLYGKAYSAYALDILGQMSAHRIMDYITEEYLKIDVGAVENCRRMKLLKVYRDMTASDRFTGDFITECKKKLINIGKYQKFFFDGITDYIRSLGYEELHQEEWKEIQNCIEKLLRQWQKYVTKSMVATMKGGTERIYRGKADFDKSRIEKCDMSEDGDNEKSLEMEDEGEEDKDNTLKAIFDLEREVQERIRNAVTRNHNEAGIKKNSNQYNHDSNRLHYAFENNYDNIITADAKGKIFTYAFRGNCVYNWWDMDDSPRVIISKACENLDMMVRINIDDSKVVLGNYEAGIFVRYRGYSVVLGVVNGRNLILDEIGVMGNDIYFEENTRIDYKNITLRMKMNNGYVRFYLTQNQNPTDEKYADGKDIKTENTDETLYELYSYCPKEVGEYENKCAGGSEEGVTVGVVCKTWGEAETLNVTFEVVYGENNIRKEVVV